MILELGQLQKRKHESEETLTSKWGIWAFGHTDDIEGIKNTIINGKNNGSRRIGRSPGSTASLRERKWVWQRQLQRRRIQKDYAKV